MTDEYSFEIIICLVTRKSSPLLSIYFIPYLKKFLNEYSTLSLNNYFMELTHEKRVPSVQVLSVQRKIIYLNMYFNDCFSSHSFSRSIPFHSIPYKYKYKYRYRYKYKINYTKLISRKIFSFLFYLRSRKVLSLFLIYLIYTAFLTTSIQDQDPSF